MSLKVIQVDPKALHPNPWNSNVVSPANEAKLDESIKRFGVFKPVICRELKDGTLQIIGGEHRAGSAVRLGITEIDVVNLGKITDKRAQEISLVDNGRFGEDDALKLSELLAGLGDIEELSKFMPYSENDLDTMFTSSSIALDELDDLDNDGPVEIPSATKGSKTHQIVRFKIPVDDLDKITDLIDKAVKVQGFTDSDSLTNAGDALVFLLLGASA